MLILLRTWRVRVAYSPVKNRSYFSTFGEFRCSFCERTIVLKPFVAAQRKSCSCNKHPIKHGLTRGRTRHSLLNIWSGMRQRCYDQNSQAFHLYGGRGIRICRAWRHSFIRFYRWGISHGWQPGLSIERINNNAGYSPHNCTFIPRARQARNRRSNKLNESKVLEARRRYANGERNSSLARAFGITPTTMCKIVHNKIWKGVT